MGFVYYHILVTGAAVDHLKRVSRVELINGVLKRFAIAIHVPCGSLSQ
jgi:hypothetical protein